MLLPILDVLLFYTIIHISTNIRYLLIIYFSIDTFYSHIITCVLIILGIEVSEMIASSHFSTQYLFKNNKEECLKKFWETRKSLFVETDNPKVRNIRIIYVSVIGIIEITNKVVYHFCT